MSTYYKTPNGDLDYSIEWSSFLDGDTISTSVWTADNTDITIDQESKTDTTTTAFFSGGLIGRSYSMTNSVATSAGRLSERVIHIDIVERED